MSAVCYHGNSGTIRLSWVVSCLPSLLWVDRCRLRRIDKMTVSRPYDIKRVAIIGAGPSGLATAKYVSSASNGMNRPAKNTKNMKVTLVKMPPRRAVVCPDRHTRAAQHRWGCLELLAGDSSCHAAPDQSGCAHRGPPTAHRWRVDISVPDVYGLGDKYPASVDGVLRPFVCGSAQVIPNSRGGQALCGGIRG